jgi:hypothetical protein
MLLLSLPNNKQRIQFQAGCKVPGFPKKVKVTWNRITSHGSQASSEEKHISLVLMKVQTAISNAP